MRKSAFASALAALACLAALAVPAAAQSPALDIKAGGQDLYLSGYLPGQPIPVSIQMACGSECGSMAEWFIWVDDPYAGTTRVHFDGATGRWVTGALTPSFRRPLADLAKTGLPGRLTLPQGYWRLRFAADLDLDGVPTENSDFYYEDVDWQFQFPQYLTISIGDGFYEDFNAGTAPGWIPDTSGSWGVRSGRYRAGATAAAGTRTYSSRYNRIFRDFSYGADVRVYSGGPDVLLRGVGLIFRGGYTYNDGYVFHINANGYYLIFKRLRGRTYLMTPSWTPSAYINRGIGAWNRLEVVATSGYLTSTPTQRFLINGKEVRQFHDKTFVAGRPGLKMFGSPASGDRFEFDNVILRVLLSDVP
jgi:hypothetical protein